MVPLVKSDLKVFALIYWWTLPPITWQTGDIVTHLNSLSISAYVWRVRRLSSTIVRCNWTVFHVRHSSEILPHSWQRLGGYSPSQPQELKFTWWILNVRQRAVNCSSFSGTFSTSDEIFYLHHPASKGSSSKCKIVSARHFQQCAKQILTDHMLRYVLSGSISEFNYIT